MSQKPPHTTQRTPQSSLHTPLQAPKRPSKHSSTKKTALTLAKREKRLKNVDIDRVYDTFVYWLSVPELDRRPHTIDLFAEQHGVTRETLRSFTERPQFYSDLEQKTILWAKSKVPAILHSLYNRISVDKHMGDMKLFLEAIRELDKKPENQTTNIMVINPTDDQYRQILSREAAALGTREAAVLDGSRS